MRGLLLGIAISASACLQPAAVDCPFGTCPPSSACDTIHARCVLPDQLVSCQGHPDDEACTAGKKAGFCDRGICVEKGCGDGRVNGSEECDGTAFLNDATDCVGIGFYQPGPIACNDDCTIDRSMCSEYCGDGVLNGQELCDYAVPDSDGSCTTAGYYVLGSVPCNVFCSYDYNAFCSGRCGDGVVNGPEVCEPTIGPPSYVTCLDYGFDSGNIGCAATCSVDMLRCRHFNLWPIASSVDSLRDIWLASANEAFVVGIATTTGRFMRWDGQTLTALPVPAGAGLNAVSGVSATNVMAVGQNGRIVHYDGAFTEMTSGVTGADLIDVHLRTATDGWAVGSFGNATHYNGSAWSAMTTATAEHLRGVWATSANDVWAVGDHGVVQHWNGTWSISSGANVLSTLFLHAVWASSASDVFAVGDGGVIAHYNGSAWTKTVVRSSLLFYSVWGAASDDVLAAGLDRATNFGVLAHFDGAKWTVLEPASDGLWAVAGVDATHVLAVDVAQRILRWEGVGDAEVQTLVDPVAGIWGTTRDNLYAATTNGVSHFDGSVWLSVATGLGMQTIWGASTSDIFAVGSQMLHYNGSNWSAMAMPPEFAMTTCNDIWGSSGTNVFTVCDSGYAFHYDGATWTRITAFMAQSPDLTAVWGTSASDIYVAGLGALFHFDGATWTSVDPDPQHLYMAMWGSSASNIYAVGYSGLVRHFDGATWTTIPVPTTRVLTSIQGTGPSDIFAAGFNVHLHFDGTSWSPISTVVPFASALWVDPDMAQLYGFDGTLRRVVRACPACL